MGEHLVDASSVLPSNSIHASIPFLFMQILSYYWSDFLITFSIEGEIAYHLHVLGGSFFSEVMTLDEYYPYL